MAACAFTSLMSQPHPAQKNLRQVYCIRTARAEEAQANCECFSDLPTQPRTHNIAGWLGCGLAQYPWPSCRNIFYRIRTRKYDLGCRRHRQRWQLRSYLWQGRRSLLRIINLPWYPGTSGTCPLNGLSLMTSVLKHRSWVSQNCLATRHLAAFTKGFVFINLGTTVST